MSCARYAPDLIEMALGGNATGELVTHLEQCGACRAEVVRLGGLQARIEHELGALLREEPSPAFLARVRQRLDERPPKRWLGRLLPAAAALAVIVLAVRVLGPPRGPKPDVASQPARVEPPAPAEPKREVAAAAPREVPRAARPLRRLPRPPTDPEVLVPKEQAELLQRLVRAMGEEPVPVSSWSAPGPAPVEVGSIDVPPIRVVPLAMEPSELKPLRMNGEGAS